MGLEKSHRIRSFAKNNITQEVVKRRHRKKPVMNLLLLNSDIYAEAISILYGQTSIVENQTYLVGFFMLLGERAVRSIQSIVIEDIRRTVIDEPHLVPNYDGGPAPWEILALATGLNSLRIVTLGLTHPWYHEKHLAPDYGEAPDGWERLERCTVLCKGWNIVHGNKNGTVPWMFRIGMDVWKEQYSTDEFCDELNRLLEMDAWGIYRRLEDEPL